MKTENVINNENVFYDPLVCDSIFKKLWYTHEKN